MEVEAVLQPGKDAPAEHYHPIREEHFLVLEGMLHVRMDGEERDLSVWKVLIILPNIPHAVRRRYSREVLWQTRPALEFEQFFETLFGLAQDGKVDKHGRLNIRQIAPIMRELDREYRLSKPPLIVQKALFGLRALAARLPGHRGLYPYPYAQTQAQ